MKLVDYSHVEKENKEIHQEVQALNQKINEVKRKKRSLEGKRLDSKEKLEGFDTFSFGTLLMSISFQKDKTINRLKDEINDLDRSIDQETYQLDDLMKELDYLSAKEKTVTAERCKYQKYRNDLHESLLKGQEEIALSYQKEYQMKEKIDDQVREVYEAVMAGRNASKACQNVVANLSSAKNWATYDLLGGGSIASLAKRDKVNKAKKDLTKLNTYIARFRDELKDINMSMTVGNLNDLQSAITFDFFVDTLLTDYHTLQLINKVDKDIVVLKDKIHHALTGLERLHKELKDASHKQEVLIEGIIMNVDFEA